MGRQAKAVGLGVVFTLVAVGFAYAVPHAVQRAADQPVGLERVVGPKVTPLAGATDDVDQGDNKQGGARERRPRRGAKDNYGAAVAVAARCEVRGRLHRELVRSIARDRQATVSDAERACEQAKASADEGTSAEGSGGCATSGGCGRRDGVVSDGKRAKPETAPGNGHGEGSRESDPSDPEGGPSTRPSGGEPSGGSNKDAGDTSGGAGDDAPAGDDGEDASPPGASGGKDNAKNDD